MQAHWKYCIKLISSYVYRAYMKYKWILYLDLGFIHEIIYMYKNIPNSIRNLIYYGSKHFR